MRFILVRGKLELVDAWRWQESGESGRFPAAQIGNFPVFCSPPYLPYLPSLLFVMIIYFVQIYNNN